MTIARSRQIDLSATPYYHCINRCVRRAFLCGTDQQSGQSYEHRRGWIADKLKALSESFAIDIAAYAVMSNHYHIILRVDKAEAESWTREEVQRRWNLHFSNTPVLVTRYLNGETFSKGELIKLDEIIETWRERLYDISWFMRILNEHIAREANKEDNVTGRFWEGRFKSQALLDEQALITCMAYVDLNPIRADMAETPEQSDFTSIQERIHKAINNNESHTLLPFQDEAKKETETNPDTENSLKLKEKALPIERNDYIALIDWSGRAILDNKRGAIPDDIPPILTRLGIDESDWIQHIHYFEKHFPTVAGCIDRLKLHARQTSRRWIKGMGMAFAPVPV